MHIVISQNFEINATIFFIDLCRQTLMIWKTRGLDTWSSLLR